MSRRRIFKLAAVVIGLLIAIAMTGTIYISHLRQQSAIDTTILWARLSPFPPQAQNFQVDVKGSMFTREFVISFDAPPAVIQQWIASSPGLSSATPVIAGSTTSFEITPGGGAEFAELMFDSSTGHVVVRTYWS